MTNIDLLWFLDQLQMLGITFSLFGMLMIVLYVLQRSVFLLSSNMLFGRAIYISAWIGTPVHELSHALFCLLFGHKIQRIVLFNPDKQGMLGYVTHSYSNRNLWQVLGNFFIGIAPLLGGLFSLYLLTYFILPEGQHLLNLLRSSVFNNGFTIEVTEVALLLKKLLELITLSFTQSPWHTLLWGYCCAAISLHLSPSKEDLKGTWVGFLLFLVIIFLGIISNQWLGSPLKIHFQAYINTVSMLSFIGIVLASVLLGFLLLCKGIGHLFK